jgi:hypothetical protein
MVRRILLVALASAAIIASTTGPGSAAEPRSTPVRAELSAPAVTSGPVASVTVVPLAARKPPKPPKPGRCGKYYEIKTSGARAMVRECRPNKHRIYVQAKVTDTKLNGRCAQVYVIYNKYPGTDYTKKVCRINREAKFRLPKSGARKGTNAFIYLREVKR